MSNGTLQAPCAYLAPCSSRGPPWGLGAHSPRWRPGLAVLLVVLLSSTCTCTSAKGGGGGKSSSSTVSRSSTSISSGSSSSSSSSSKWYGTSSGSTATSGSSSYYPRTTYYVYGKSYGSTSTGLRLATVSILTSYVYFNGYTYPSVRFYYYNDTSAGTYFDDCALRNASAAQQGLSDSSIDLATVNALPQLIPESAASADLLAFNATLFNATNGLIVDPAYCNYTFAGAAGLGPRWRAAWSLALAAAVAVLLLPGDGGSGRWR